MAKKTAKDTAELSVAELEKKVRDLRAELLQLRLRRQTGQLEKPHLMMAHRREVARCLTHAARKRAAASATV